MSDPYKELTGFLAGNITISRPNNSDIDYVTIEVVDERNRIQFIEIRVQYEKFLMALMGLAMQDCTYEIRGKSLIGSTRETKQIRVDISQLGFMPTEDEYKAALKPYEIDGWIGALYDIKNFKNHREGTDSNGNRFKVADVTFKRYV